MPTKIKKKKRTLPGGEAHKLEQVDAPMFWEPSTKDPNKAIDKAFGLWSDDEQPQTKQEAQGYQNKLWRSDRRPGDRRPGERG